MKQQDAAFGPGVSIMINNHNKAHTRKKQPKEIELLTTICFNEEVVSIPELSAEVTCRLSSIKLSLCIDNASFVPDNNFPSKFPKENLQQRSSVHVSPEISLFDWLSLSIDFPLPMAYQPPAVEFGYENRDMSKLFWLLRATKQFKTLGDVPIINERIGTLHIEEITKKCSFTASISVRGSRDFYFTGLRKFFGHQQVSNELRGCIEIFICKKFFLIDNSSVLCELRADVGEDQTLHYEIIRQLKCLSKLTDSDFELIKKAVKQSADYPSLIDLGSALNLDPERDYRNANLDGISLQSNSDMNLDLSGSLIRNANFAGDLKGLNLSNTDLSGATFQDADLRGVSFFNANLDEAIFNNIQADQKTSFIGVTGINPDARDLLRSQGAIIQPSFISTYMQPDCGMLIDIDEMAKVNDYLLNSEIITHDQSAERLEAFKWLLEMRDGLGIDANDQRSMFVNAVAHGILENNTRPIDHFLNEPTTIIDANTIVGLKDQNSPPICEAYIDYSVDRVNRN
jgi:uncharacterized protein YjbI with pentapeptide repeats